jgi:hypothetical protein
MTRLERRGIVEDGRLTRYGKLVEALPVERAWAELIVNAEDELLPFLAITSSIESLHRMTREERDLEGLVVHGSDHLTAYNLYAEAYREAGYIGQVYGLPRQLFDAEKVEAWAERRGVLVKALDDAALAMASVYRSVGVPLPDRMPFAGERVHRRFADLVAQFMPFDLVIDEETAWGEPARVSKSSVCGSWGAVAGTLRYFADRFGIPRASIEGTQIPLDLVRKYAVRSAPELVYEPRRKHAPLVLERRVEYHGFELEREVEGLDGEWPAELVPQVRAVLARALARNDARHVAVRRNLPVVEEIREVWRRSGGQTPRLAERELAEWYRARLDAEEVRDLHAFRAADLRLRRAEFVSDEEVERYAALPDAVEVRERDVPLSYEVEETMDGPVGVARLRLPEKMARTLVEEELPTVDRPLRFLVLRGQRGAVRGDTLDELQEKLDLPWAPEEVGDDGAYAARDGGAGEDRHRRRPSRSMRGGSREESRGEGRGEGGGRGPRGGGRGGRGGRKPGFARGARRGRRRD